MKKIYLLIATVLICLSSSVYAYYYEKGKEIPETDLKYIIFEDLYYPALDYKGNHKRDKQGRLLYLCNKYVNEIAKATQITIDKDNHKLIEGYEDGSFKPDKEITRAEFIKMAIGLSVNRNFDFSVIPSSHVDHNWAGPYVAVAEMQNVIDEGEYTDRETLNSPIQRIEMIKILSRIQINMKGVSQYRNGELHYTDISSLTQEEQGYLLHAAYYELIEGMLSKKNSEFKPFSSITRAEAARALIRVY